MKKLSVKSQFNNYSVIIKNDILDSLENHLDNNKFYVIIHDDNIPKIYVDKVVKACLNNIVIDFPEGEKSKSFEEYQRIISVMQSKNVKRDACIISVGGGVTGDLSGFIAATYLRGIEYIQIPTTLLSQIDSSVGGKVAINTLLAKNSVGAFYPPSKVLIDPNTLKTLSKRHFNNGMAEAIKYGMIYSKDLFEEILNSNVEENLELFIYKCLKIKQFFVEGDELDSSIRQKLNFGHTYGHAYERYYNFEKYLHGESVALGMVKSTKSKKTQSKLTKALLKYSLPISDDVDENVLLSFIKNDKKNTKDHLNVITVREIGKSEIEKIVI